MMIVLFRSWLRVFEYLQDLFTGSSIEVTCRLVGENQIGIGDDRARDCDALFLSAGELARLVVHPVRESNEFERRFHVLAPLRFAELCQQQRKFYVFEGGEYGYQIERLKDVTDMRVTPRCHLTLIKSGK